LAGIAKLFEDGCPTRARYRRMRLRHAALVYARHGWMVLAGSRLCGDRFKCGPGCRTIACHPVAQRWDEAATTDAATIEKNWRRSPFSVLLPTGSTFDAVEVPARMGARMGDATAGPVLVTPTGQWLFLVSPGERLRPELARHHDVVLHGLGSWIPAPPVRAPEGPMRWAVAPSESDWRLPEPRPVQSALVATLSWLGFPANGHANSPGQLRRQVNAAAI
jgi:hypothetical protein